MSADDYRGWENVGVEVEGCLHIERRAVTRDIYERRVDGPTQERQQALLETTAQGIGAVMDSIGTIREEAQASLDTTHEALDATREIARIKEEMQKRASGKAERLGAWATLDALESLPDDIFEAEQEMLDAQQAASDHKRGKLADAQEAVRMAEVDASLEAFAEAVDGKNKEIRDVQLAAFLGRDPGVIEARRALRQAEDKQAQLEAQVASAELALKGAVNRFKATCYAAELQTQLVRLMAG